MIEIKDVAIGIRSQHNRILYEIITYHMELRRLLLFTFFTNIVLLLICTCYYVFIVRQKKEDDGDKQYGMYIV